MVTGHHNGPVGSVYIDIGKLYQLEESLVCTRRKDSNDTPRKHGALSLWRDEGGGKPQHTAAARVASTAAQAASGAGSMPLPFEAARAADACTELYISFSETRAVTVLA